MSDSYEFSGINRGKDHWKYSDEGSRVVAIGGLEGPIGEWAEYRTRKFGEKIVSKFLYPEEVGGRLHRVAWLERKGIETEKGTPFHLHHIACDCIVEVEDDWTTIFSCPGVHSALNHRAIVVAGQYGFNEIAAYFKTAEDGFPELTEKGKALAAATITALLERDKYHPSSWVANLVSGQHEVSLLAIIMNEHPDLVRELVREMEDSGLISVEGESVELST